jgi:hypothetical protein
MSSLILLVGKSASTMPAQQQQQQQQKQRHQQWIKSIQLADVLTDLAGGEFCIYNACWQQQQQSRRKQVLFNASLAAAAGCGSLTDSHSHSWCASLAEHRSNRVLPSVCQTDVSHM